MPRDGNDVNLLELLKPENLPDVSGMSWAQAAMAYARAGWPVFPLRPGTKIPLPGSRGFKDATADLAQVAAWWQEIPDANIGISPEHVGACVIDIEREATEAEIAGLGLPETLTIRSASGGLHSWLLGSLPSKVRKLSPNSDTRGVGGYVAMPPSLIDTRDEKAAKDPSRCGAYTVLRRAPIAPLPSHIAERLQRAPAPPRQAADGVDLIDEIAASPAELLAEATRLIDADLKALGEPIDGAGSDDRTYRMAAKLRDLSRDGKALSNDAIADLLAERWAPGFNHGWLLGKVANTGVYGQNARGCDPVVTPAEVFARFVQPPSIEDRIAAVFCGAADKRKGKIDFKALINPPPGKPAEFFLNGWIERASHTLFDGTGGTGKSTKAQDYLIEISAEHNLPAFSLSYEETSAKQYERRDAFARAGKWQIEDAGLTRGASSQMLATDNFHLIDLKDPTDRDLRRTAIVVMTGGFDGKIVLTEDGLEILAYIAERAPCIVLADGLMDAFLCLGNTRNDDAMVRRLLHSVEDYCAEFDITWISILHPSRAGEDRTGGGSYAPAWTTVPRGIHRFTREEGSGIIHDTIAPGSNHQRVGDKRSYRMEADALREVGRVSLTPAEAAARLIEDMARQGTPLRRDLSHGDFPAATSETWFISEFRQRTNLPNRSSVEKLRRAIAELANDGRIIYRDNPGGRARQPAGYYPAPMN